jgi:hypothetical protein
MKIRMLTLTLAAVLLSVGLIHADPMQQLIDTLGSEYEALVPPPSSSVGTDYPTRQAALGAFYTARSIGLLYDQNQALLTRQDALLSRYDEIIEQNRQIINLLRTISERITPPKVPPPPAPSAGGYTE